LGLRGCGGATQRYRQAVTRRPTWSGVYLSVSATRFDGRRLACPAALRLLGDDCQSSGLYGPVRSGQVRQVNPARVVKSCRDGGASVREGRHAGPCQRFARNCATPGLASPHDPTLGRVFHLCIHVVTRGSARCRELPEHQWHARGQGFMPPQLHHSIWGALCPIRARGLDRRSPAGSEPAGQQADALMSGAALSRR
jgi:hypothetical protein